MSRKVRTSGGEKDGSETRAHVRFVPDKDMVGSDSDLGHLLVSLTNKSVM